MNLYFLLHVETDTDDSLTHFIGVLYVRKTLEICADWGLQAGEFRIASGSIYPTKDALRIRKNVA